MASRSFSLFRRRFRIAAASLPWLTMLSAQTGSPGAAVKSAEGRVSRPVAGYIFDPSALAVRPIYGLPGAALLGEGLALPVRIRLAAVSPRHDYILAVSADPRRLVVLGNLSGSVSVHAVGGVGVDPDVIVVSPAGTSAVLYDRKARGFQIVSGLPNAPVSSDVVDASTLDPAGAMAVSDDGIVFVATPPGDGPESRPTPLFVITPPAGGFPASIRYWGQVDGAPAISFLRGTSSALIADGQRNELNLVPDVNSDSAPRRLAGPRDGISRPIAVAASRDNRLAFVANAGSQTVLTLDMGSGASRVTACDCAITELFPLSGYAVFLLNEFSGQPMWLFDGDAPDPRVHRVPRGTPR